VEAAERSNSDLGDNEHGRAVRAANGADVGQRDGAAAEVLGAQLAVSAKSLGRRKENKGNQENDRECEHNKADLWWILIITL